MPIEHQKAAQWDGERFRKWANKIGPNTYKVIDYMLKSYKVEQQGYNGAMSILKLSDNYSPSMLEEACKITLKYTINPRYKNIKALLESGQITEDKEIETNNEGAIIRGASYYGDK